MSDDDAWVLQIVMAGEKVLAYIRGVDQDAFEWDEMLHDAVMLQLVVIGEAAGKLSAAFRGQHAKLPWVKIRATRNIIAHSYAIVDLGRIWLAATKGVPELLAVLKPLVPPDEPSDAG